MGATSGWFSKLYKSLIEGLIGYKFKMHKNVNFVSADAWWLYICLFFSLVWLN